MRTKIAVLADIHSNKAALDAALGEIDADPSISHIYCLGDMIAIGHETNGVLETLFSRKDVTLISGNHDEGVVAAGNGGPIPEGSAEGERAHHEWVASGLDPKFTPQLEALEKELLIEIEGRMVLFTHYHLDSDKQILPIDTEPSGEKLDAQYAGYPADIVCFGHHHPVHYFKTIDRIYINPGSLGCCDEPYGRYATITFGSDIDVELKKAHYENKAFLAGYEEQDVPEKDFILEMFHGNQHLK
ncbi:metallophosphoesterase family protein [Planococcus lenghuensis]|uniref:Calcineurin-like phosphoesterase domain-containing protein n=1 Tax=Planococcus lenghuensis TaxID=2213202 RepID=A0A1Q2L3T6_9BACL|nr:metallophosphoesterase family protein [Planococcus lenghuensis]AQQ55089.1 hypothetical protein B0X71_10670 [Planococcus lenghuensis]